MNNIDVMKVAIVGELTTEEWPGIDDHFLVLVLKDGSQIELPTDHEAVALITHELAAQRGIAIDYGLCNCTNLNSRISYPYELRGEPLYDFSGRPPDLNSRIAVLGAVAGRQPMMPRALAYLERGS